MMAETMGLVHKFTRVEEREIKSRSQIQNLSKSVAGVLYCVREEWERSRFEGENQIFHFGHVISEKPIRHFRGDVGQAVLSSRGRSGIYIF